LVSRWLPWPHYAAKHYERTTNRPANPRRNRLTRGSLTGTR